MLGIYWNMKKSKKIIFELLENEKIEKWIFELLEKEKIKKLIIEFKFFDVSTSEVHQQMTTY